MQKSKRKHASKSRITNADEVLLNTRAADNEIFLQPWYLPRKTFLAIRQLLPSAQLLKMRYYFDDYGCLKCGKSGGVYSSNGMCARCAIVVRARVVTSLKRRFEKLGIAIKDRPIQAFLGDRTNTQITRLAGPLLRKGRQAMPHANPRKL